MTQMQTEEISVPIPGMPLTMYPNPFGGGWVLACNRGIPCEEHTQVVSAHATNPIEASFIRQAIDKHAAAIKKSWDGFVDLASGWNAAGQDFQTLEGIGVQVLRMWCERIVSIAEKLSYADDAARE